MDAHALDAAVRRGRGPEEVVQRLRHLGAACAASAQRGEPGRPSCELGSPAAQAYRGPKDYSCLKYPETFQSATLRQGMAEDGWQPTWTLEKSMVCTSGSHFLT